ncbi:beta-arrestin-1-like [Mustelus asterias]
MTGLYSYQAFGCLKFTLTQDIPHPKAASSAIQSGGHLLGLKQVPNGDQRNSLTTPGKMSLPQTQKTPAPSVVIAKMNPPPAAPKNVVFKKTTPDKSLNKRTVDMETPIGSVPTGQNLSSDSAGDSCSGESNTRQNGTTVSSVQRARASGEQPTKKKLKPGTKLHKDDFFEHLQYFGFISPEAVVLEVLSFSILSPFSQIAVYLGKRDFIDHVTHTDLVDGVLVLDTGYIKERKVYCRLLCAFRYGREDIDVCGLKFRRDLYVTTLQVYPPPSGEKPKPQTKLQERLAKKFGDKAYPFHFQFPDYLPCSVTLQLGPNEIDKCCGVDFQISAFCAKTLNIDMKISKRSSVLMVIRKMQYAPDKPIFQPVAKTTRQFLMSDKPLHLEASLNKEIFYHGEPVEVSVEVINHSTKTVKKIKITADQITSVVLYSHDKYTQNVAGEETDEQVTPGSTLKKTYTLYPIIANNREKHGMALDGKIRDEDTNLASTTILKEGIDHEVWGILVSYRVKVKLVVSGMLGDVLFSDLAVELPFLLMHPKPLTESPSTEGGHLAHLIDLLIDDDDDDDIQFEDFDRGGPMAVTEDLKEETESLFKTSNACRYNPANCA